MVRIRIVDGHLCQWDLDRKVEITTYDEVVSEVHFSTFNSKDALIVEVENPDRKVVVNIPNILLQNGAGINIYAVSCIDGNERTLGHSRFDIKKRPKPTDYVYTETEVRDYEKFKGRLEYLEGEGLEKAIAEYFAENPVETGATEKEAAQIEQNKTDIEDLQKSKLSTEELPNAIDTALAQAKESGQFDGKDGKDGVDGENGKDGADGHTPVKGTDYFTNADKEEIIAAIFTQVVDGSEVSY